jgi:hypothetical protein
MKAIIQMNAIKNNPVTTEDVDIAEKIFRPDVATLRGKTTRYAPVPVIEDRIKIPRELITAQYSVTICLNGMIANDISFLTIINKNLMYQTARYIQRPLRKHLLLVFACNKCSESNSGRILSYYNSL